MRLSHPVRYVPLDLRGAALALLVSIFWGANPVAIKIGLEDAPPFRLAALRFLLGGAVILVWGGLSGRLHRFRIAPEEWRPLVVLGVLLCAQIGSMNYATTLTSAAHVAIILNLYAVHTVVLAHFLIPGDRLTARKLAGVLIAYAGIVVLFARQAPGGTATLAGDALMFLSALVLAERTVYLARAVQTFDPTTLLLTQAAIGTAFFFALSHLVEPEPVRWTLGLASALAFQGVVVAGFNFVVNLWLLKRYRMSALSGFFLTQPIFGVIAAALLTGDPLTLELLVASVAVAVGIGLTTR
jgi:drug/metabolite transporter (DMT)-like permease